MSRSLPDRPDLDQLRRRAKELRAAAQAGEPAARNRFAAHVGAPAEVTLSLAQLVIAREYGFASWSKLKAAVDVHSAPDLAALVDGFLAASIDGRRRLAARLLAGDRRIATYDISTAALLGDVAGVRELLAADPTSAIRPDDRRAWPPLLYACYSRWHQIDPGRAAGLAQAVRVLLEAGASADTNDGGRPRFRSRNIRKK